jgi:hypothetical protein
VLRGDHGSAAFCLPMALIGFIFRQLAFIEPLVYLCRSDCIRNVAEQTPKNVAANG